jgi:hypothetical protein
MAAGPVGGILVTVELPSFRAILNSDYAEKSVVPS